MKRGGQPFWQGARQRMRPPHSLRARLLILLIGGCLAFAIVVTSLLHRHIHHEVDELFDEQLRQVAVNLLVIAEHGAASAANATNPANPALPAPALVERDGQHFRFQILDRNGAVRLRSPEAPLAATSGPDGYSDHTDATGYWRELRLTAENGQYQAWIAEHHGYRDVLIEETVLRIQGPLLLGLPLLALWVWLSTGQGLAPLTSLAHALESRGADKLDQLDQFVPPDPHAPPHPLGLAKVPQEVRPLVSEINRLLAEVEHALNAERRFTAEAAHELRTPLAALRAQSQVALRARNADERQHALQQMLQGIDHSAHLVEQMLALARLDPKSGSAGPNGLHLELLPLTPLAEEVCASLGHTILAKRLEFDLQTDDRAMVSGQRDWLQVLLRNLVDNAVRYTPTGGQVCVTVARLGNHGCHLQVADSGPGIAPALRQQALARFHRLNQRGESKEGGPGGSGLGLSIVARIAELHGATLQLETAAAGGLLVTVRFPPPKKPAA